ncbi:tryptophan halogenase [Thalassotalea insulae]|uniref:Tryptophan halogenase n=1 Tax=Thalassotalea insulae TaxID=2056778 RepID=A0ABQ6GQP8_9GAMM|nr:tryptophan halogenase family protein [Thalassotalea insulae]GLX77954.1 tryptophan halogenase [Thalassotalea insulae]
MIKSIVVLGGGTAGWLTASLIAAKHVNDYSPFKVTLVESPNIPTIGVGEGTWPTMVNTLKQLGISELTFMQHCDASFKQASKFVHWVNGKENDYYYHPFTPPQSFEDLSLVAGWQKLNVNGKNEKFADAVSLQTTLCQQKKAPKQLKLGDFNTIENYGYHLDAGKFAKLLTEHGVNKLGVIHVLDDVIDVISDENGDIAALMTQEHGNIEGDLFIDCSGQAAKLIGQHYNVPFISKKDVLFIDKAIATQVPYKTVQDPVESATISTAQSAGWIWDIGLPTRRGVGHVFSSKYISVEQAKAQLKEYLHNSVTDVEQLQFRVLDINPGHREVFWHKNCVAVGMSSGFLEPLEASALVMVELAAKTIALHMPASREVMDIVALQYNDNMRFRWQRIIDFLKLHYVLSERDDEGFWRDNRDLTTIPDSLQALLRLWYHQAPDNNGFLSPYDLFPAASYQYILYGMGFKTQENHLGNPVMLAKRALQAFSKVKERQDKMPGLLPTNREILNEIHQLNRDVTLDIDQSTLGYWHYLCPTKLNDISQRYPIFFKKESQGFTPIYLTSLSDKTKKALSMSHDTQKKSWLTNELATMLNQPNFLEPVKLAITLNDDTDINVSGLHVIEKNKWQQVKLSNKLPAQVSQQLEVFISSLQHVPRLIEQENNARS